MTTRTKTKPTIVDATFVEQTHAVPEATLFEQLKIQIPEDWRRRAVAAVAGLAASMGVGYAMATLTEYAIVGALLLTNSAFLALLIFLAGLFVAMYVGSNSSVFVYANIVNKNIDRVFASANTTVRGWFSRSSRTEGVTT